MASVAKSKSDIFYRRLVISKFFSKGWGDLDIIKRLFDFRLQFKDREKCVEFVPPNYPVHLDRSWKTDSHYIAEGHFLSPVAKQVPGLLPEQSEIARFQVILPTKWPDKTKKPVCIHLAGTGDHFYWRRRNFMAKPLLKEHGVASILLENPFYGSRKPKDQQRSSLKYVVDLFIMGAGLILESSVLLHWCERHGYGPLAITGISMGGHMASLAATVWPKPLAVIPCLSWSTASCVFTQGVLRNSLPWKHLTKQLHNEKYREALIDLAGLRQEVSHKNLFSNNLTQSLTPNIKTRDVQPPGRASDDHVNMYQVNERELDTAGSLNYPHTLSLDKKDMLTSVKNAFMGYIPSQLKGQADHQANNIDPETLEFMNILMDKATHLKDFSRPVEPSLAKFVAAKHDAYVPWDHVDGEPQTLWPGCEVDFVDAGHIGASLYHLNIFRHAIKEKLDQM